MTYRKANKWNTGYQGLKTLSKAKFHWQKHARRKPQDVWKILKEHYKLSINADDILCRTNGEVCQIILPRIYKEAIRSATHEYGTSCSRQDISVDKE